MKIYDLVYFDRLNEGAVIQTSKNRRRIFTVSVILGVVGTLLLMAQSLPIGLIGAVCVIFFLFGFFISFASGVPAFFDKRPVRKYRGQNLLVFRILTAKLATMGIVMAVISMIFTATLIAEGTGFIIHGLVKGRSAGIACFDLYFGIEGNAPNPDPYLDYITEHIPVEQSLLYQVYLTGSSQVRDYINDHIVYYSFDYDQTPVLRWSDYAAMRAIAGYPAVEPEPGRYIIHCTTYLEDTLRDYTQAVTLGETVLAPGSVYTEYLSQSFGVSNGEEYILVVPDEAAEGLPVHHLAYAAKTVGPVTEADYDVLGNIAYKANREYDELGNPPGYAFVSTKANETAEVASQTTVFVFPLFYLALALTVTAASILTIQQLSETEHYRQQFVLLRKLGMARREMARALRNQFAIYYAMPAIPPIMIAVPFILNLALTPEPGVMIGMSSPAAILTISLGAFFLIYALYILLAYTSLKRNVLPR